jgi:hypothetical protein
MQSTKPQRERRRQLEQRVAQLSRVALFGTLSETYRACGSPGCRCHGPGPKHGPYLTISYRSDAGRTTGYSVPKGAETAVREGVEAWRMLQQCLRELADATKERVLARARAEREKST